MRPTIKGSAMKERIDKRDLSFLRNQVDLLALRLEDLSIYDEKTISQILVRLGNLEDELMGRKAILNAKEAAAYLGVSVDKLYRMVKEGLPHFRNVRKYFFERQAINDWVRNNSNS